jgi:hypothetical protein
MEDSPFGNGPSLEEQLSLPLHYTISEFHHSS